MCGGCGDLACGVGMDASVGGVSFAPVAIARMTGRRAIEEAMVLPAARILPPSLPPPSHHPAFLTPQLSEATVRV